MKYWRASRSGINKKNNQKKLQEDKIQRENKKDRN